MSHGKFAEELILASPLSNFPRNSRRRASSLRRNAALYLRFALEGTVSQSIAFHSLADIFCSMTFKYLRIAESVLRYCFSERESSLQKYLASLTAAADEVLTDGIHFARSEIGFPSFMFLTSSAHCSSMTARTSALTLSSFFIVTRQKRSSKRPYSETSFTSFCTSSGRTVASHLKHTRNERRSPMPFPRMSRSMKSHFTARSGFSQNASLNILAMSPSLLLRRDETAKLISKSFAPDDLQPQAPFSVTEISSFIVLLSAFSNLLDIFFSSFRFAVNVI